MYSIAFGIRNVTVIPEALAEARRVLRPGGRFVCLEFSQVTNPLLRSLYEPYSFAVIPKIGELVADDRASYQYLVESIRKFPDQETFAQMIRDAVRRRPPPLSPPCFTKPRRNHLWHVHRHTPSGAELARAWCAPGVACRGHDTPSPVFALHVAGSALSQLHQPDGWHRRHTLGLPAAGLSPPSCAAEGPCQSADGEVSGADIKPQV